ncbi:MAG: hypothetical protein KAJ32_09060, partial [Gammaproteobacteria bacterium]|nr:hypothetical protein [Gammaproteobacteria bacterium]
MNYRSLLRTLFTLLLLQWSLTGVAHAGSELPRFLDAIDVQDIYPDADEIGSPDGDPIVAPAFKQGEQIGYVFLTSDYVNTTGYSGKPIHQLVSMDINGVIRKALLVEHHEPIVLIGIPEKRITAILQDYQGMDVGKLVQGALDHDVDIVTGATVTVMVMDDNILRSAIKVARNYGLAGLKPEQKKTGPIATVNPDIDNIVDWVSLVREGSVRRLKLTLEQINEAYNQIDDFRASDFPEEGKPGEVFIELYAAVVSIPSIGR